MSKAEFEFRRLEQFRWEAYEVASGGEPIGFVSQLPEGLWLAYRLDGFRKGQLADREQAAQVLQDLALAGSPSELPSRAAGPITARPAPELRR